MYRFIAAGTLALCACLNVAAQTDSTVKPPTTAVSPAVDSVKPAPAAAPAESQAAPAVTQPASVPAVVADPVEPVPACCAGMKKEHCKAMMSGCPRAEASKGKATLSGSIEIEGQRTMWDNHSTNTLDRLFGRFNLGAAYARDNFKLFINLRAYPLGFGYEALTSVTTDGYLQLEQEKTSFDKFQVENAWAQFSFKYLAVKIGHMSTSLSATEFFGNYLDQDWTGGAFGSRISYHNATVFSNTTGMLTSELMLGVGDNLINRGYLRIVETVNPIKNLNLSAGFRTNCFDLIKYPNEALGYRGFIAANYEVMPKLVPYLEIGFTDRERIRPRLISFGTYYSNLIDNDPDYYQHTYLYPTYEAYVDSLNSRMKQYDRLTPMTAGISVPTGGYLDDAGIEGELLVRSELEKIGLANAKMGNLNIYLVKNLGSHANLRASFFTDPNTDSYQNWDFALRFTSRF